MAKIETKTESGVYRIQKFLGLNECPDGDTQLRLGEAGEMRNWQVTPQHHLRVRPGYRSVERFQGPVRGLWSGFVAGKRKLLCAADGGVWDLTETPARRIGDIWDDQTTMFGFGGKVYFLNGHEYLVWDGEGFVDTVEGYVPLVATAMAPAGGGTTVENVNRLTGKRRCRFSADGEAVDYHLPEQELLSVDKVTVDDETVAAYTADKMTGILTFDEAPEAGNSNVEIWYTVRNTLRSDVEAMRFAEQFNGAADTRVFLYGDGKAVALYCGITEDGTASAEYFPDLYEILVGSENSPITGMIKYYDRLMSYKSDGGAYATKYEITELADGSVIPGFKTVSINREIGNEAMGQVRLVQNTPRTLYGGQVYDWVMANYATRDERNAICVGQRVRQSVKEADKERVFCFDDDSRQEYYIFLNDQAGTVLVHHYGIDVWYRYTALPAVCGAADAGYVYLGLSDGRVVRLSEEYPNDDGEAIDAFFASGHMAFEQEWRKKYSAVTWVSVKPTANAWLEAAMTCDRDVPEQVRSVEIGLSSLKSADFARWSFLTNRSPHIRRLKLKLKRFVYCRLLLRSCHPASDATVLAVDVQVQYGGKAK